ncbi:MAG: 2-phospho-L-lactate transferase [Variibacter sp.]|nr:2-phospho-L-lactate transferase [Variibacter sp.]
MTAASRPGPVVALSGGIGGAKLALGLSRVVDPARLLVVANTGDDFEHLGLAISPDIDTLMYTLAGLSDPERGWGLRDETWAFMGALKALGGETWFQLGDRDLATHVERTRRLAAGESLSQITHDFCRRLGVAARIVPMSDHRVRTRLQTGDGWIDFQDYFVRLRSEPAVTAITFAGADEARAQADFIAALAAPDLRCVIVCPSNPFISIDPILAVAGVREALRACAAPVVAVSPIVGGAALKGPTAKMMSELGLRVTATAVAAHYGDWLDGYLVDESEAQRPVPGRATVTRAPIVMRTLEDREALARDVLALADRLAPAKRARRASP